MDPVEAEAEEQPPDEEEEEEGYVETDPAGRFIRYDEIVGTGAVKTVYKAFDKLEGVEVAWSQSRIDDSVMGSSKKMEQLNREIQLLKTLKHKNIEKMFASWVDEEKKTVNIITELFTSGSLRQYRRKHKKVNIKAMKRWAIQILTGLEYLHCQKPAIIHRDLKCDNIFINGNHGKVKIGDFGLATFMQQQKKSIKGTLEFMAPELLTGHYNQLVDIYSFGMCMLEMVTCEYPYSECQGMAHIFKKVVEGKKPDAFYKIKDAEVRSFIESCLAPVEKRMSATELLNGSFLQNDVPISVSLVKNMSEDGHESVSFMLWKGQFLLKGNVDVASHVDLWLRFPDPSGFFKNVEFPFDVTEDTSLSVAVEMVEQFGLTEESRLIIAQLIDAFMVILIPEWAPCVTIGHVVSEGANSNINESMNCGQFRSADPE
ncbi:probable serine/threonine-protein kinase WNK9 [Oryza brachyantha]|uniref:non-specific serine/threonine protein kinase n=1 Tax=Oryza brachyantha TaxID=4533 RepID=J3NBL4_ORYBR|nr:probable serine/threonine-protein kinase WNK9 [Oryza brachyantha]